MEGKITLMVQSSDTLFCYFHVNNGSNTICNFKLALKVYCIDNGIENELKIIEIKNYTDNWYIHLDSDDLDVFVKLVKLNGDNTFDTIGVSNVVTTPRKHPSQDKNVYYLNKSTGDIKFNPKKDSECSDMDFFENYYNKLNENSETITSRSKYEAL